MITKKTQYALQALLCLAKSGGYGPVRISELSKREKIPKKFLETILLTLKHHGILKSKKGKGGGYVLGKAPSCISVGEVIRIFEGPIAPVGCVSDGVVKCQEGADEATCGIRIVMIEVRDAMARILDGTTLGDLLHRAELARQKSNRSPERSWEKPEATTLRPNVPGTRQITL